MKTKRNWFFSVTLFFAVIVIGCEKDYEIIDLKNAKCPCEHETNFIKKTSNENVLLFDANKTTLSEMHEFSYKNNSAVFISYTPESDSTYLYYFKDISNENYLGISYICNFPEIAKSWTIPSNGIYISFTADAFEACYSYPSAGFTQLYSDIILTSLKRKVK